MNAQSLFLKDEAATLALAADFSQALMQQGSLKTAAWDGLPLPHTAAPFIIYLQGDLGSGKTTFVRGFLRGLGYQGVVKSPTYNLVESYVIAAKKIAHFDLYRFQDPMEWEDAGLDDEVNAADWVFIEWPSLAAGFVPAGHIILTFDIKDGGRMCTITSFT